MSATALRAYNAALCRRCKLPNAPFSMTWAVHHRKASPPSAAMVEPLIRAFYANLAFVLRLISNLCCKIGTIRAAAMVYSLTRARLPSFGGCDEEHISGQCCNSCAYACTSRGRSRPRHETPRQSSSCYTSGFDV